ncbi:MAG: WXG100 family type VII secretion target, partial [Caldilineaceae bacterium]|nr:WXG100 family type VII secretion target [Caldilineaceae bacterium]
MTASIIQANYEQLEQIATRFGRATEAQDRLMRTIRDRADVLTRGSWEGEGGDAFARELDGEVMPAMQRLADALQEAQRATLKMSVVIRTAEEEAARLFISDSVAAGVISDETGRNLTDTISSAGELEPPNSMGDLYALIEDPDAPPIQISKLPNGEYLVLIKGTDGWTGGSNVWSTNVYTGIGLPSVYTKRIQQAIAEQIPPGSTIHFAGHSQGGHAVQVIGAQYYRNGDYKIGSITSFGANYSAVIPLGLRDRMNAYLTSLREGQ